MLNLWLRCRSHLALSMQNYLRIWATAQCSLSVSHVRHYVEGKWVSLESPKRKMASGIGMPSHPPYLGFWQRLNSQSLNSFVWYFDYDLCVCPCSEWFLLHTHFSLQSFAQYHFHFLWFRSVPQNLTGKLRLQTTVDFESLCIILASCNGTRLSQNFSLIKAFNPKLIPKFISYYWKGM